MEVRKAGTAGPPRGVRLGYVAAGGALAAVLSAPALLVAGYARVVSTLLVLAVLAGGIRLLVGTAVALPGEPPSVAPPRPLPPASVIVTAYDEADVLPATIAACTDLEYPADRFEILVCYETASTDGTAAVAEAAAAADGPVRAIAREASPAGKAAVTNLGLARATGEVVAVLDADQRLRPDALWRAAGHLRQPDVRCVTGRRVGTNPTASLVALFATVEHHLAERIEFVARDRLGGFALFTGGQAFFDATVFADLGGFDEEVLLEDVEFACRLQAAGGEVAVDPAIVSLERNPTTVSAWWSQRVRWARGGMQAARTYLPSLVSDAPLSGRARLDAAATLGSLLCLPLLALAAPAMLVGLAGRDVGPLLPGWWPLAFGVAVAVVPWMATAGVVLVDRRAGQTHAKRELLAAVALPVYAALQVLAVVTAFLGEFVLARPAVYVTSSEPSGTPETTDR